MRRGITTTTVRRATNRDQKQVLALVYEVLAEYGLQGEEDATDACLRDIEANYRGGLFEVVEDDEGLAGCYGLMPHAPGTVELRKMYLRRRARGQGIGKLLMRRALARAKELGFTRVELDTAAPLREAIQLYETFGFKTFPKDGIPARCDRAMVLELR